MALGWWSKISFRNDAANAYQDHRFAPQRHGLPHLPVFLSQPQVVLTTMKVLITGGLPDLLVRLWHHLSQRRKRQFVLLLGLMLVSAFAEVVSLGAVLPFLGILTAPERVFNHPVVADVAQAWG